MHSLLFQVVSGEAGRGGNPFLLTVRPNPEEEERYSLTGAVNLEQKAPLKVINCLFVQRDCSLAYVFMFS